MASSCKDQRQALLECLADSPCIIAGKPIADCVKLSTDETGCKEFNTAFFLCKRGQLDMRKRIKGNIGVDTEAAPIPESAAPDSPATS